MSKEIEKNIANIIANSTLYVLGVDGHNALSELTISLLHYMESEITKAKEQERKRVLNILKSFKIFTIPDAIIKELSEEK